MRHIEYGLENVKDWLFRGSGGKVNVYLLVCISGVEY
jgi:hypothetical protein